MQALPYEPQLRIGQSIGQRHLSESKWILADSYFLKRYLFYIHF
jgi:hypothetical protein